MITASDECIGGNIPQIWSQKKTWKRSYKFQQHNQPTENLHMDVRKKPPLHIVSIDIPGVYEQCKKAISGYFYGPVTVKVFDSILVSLAIYQCSEQFPDV